MSTAEVQRGDAGTLPDVAHVDLKLEAIVIPVSDVDRAKKFYGSLGWRLHADFPFDNVCASSSSPRPGRGARSSPAATSPRPRPARPKVST